MNRKFLKDYPALLPLLMLSVLSVALIVGRVVATGTERFWFLNWNLFLAWLPVLWAWLLSRELRKNRWLSWRPLLLTFLWIVFLPNSFYLVSDFIHLEAYEGVSLLFDAVMFMSFALSGLLLGLTSVYLVHRELVRRLPKKFVWPALLLAFLLASFAIYLGRYLGWNSWDLLLNPFNILVDLADRAANPGDYPSMFTTTCLFFVFISCSYFSFYGTLRALKSAK